VRGRIFVVSVAWWCCVSAAAAAGSGEQRGLEEVVVTAQRREERLLDAPIAVSAFTAADLDRAAADDLSDISLLEPSLSTNQVGTGGANVFLRGVGNEIIGVGTDSSVAIYLDGVYLPRFTTALENFVDVERIEVVKGPQGTLYGRNATGGAINIITREPQAQPSLTTDVQLSNYRGRRVRLAAGVPLAEALSARISMIHSQRDHYAYNPFLDQRLQGEDLVAGNASLKWTPTDDLEILLRYDRTRDDALGVAAVKVVARPVVPVPADSWQINSDMPDTKGELRSEGASLVARLNLGDVRLISQTAWRDFDTLLNIDTDGYQLPLNHFRNTTETSESFSQELRVLSTGQGAWEWMAGLFYFQEDARQNLNVFGLVPIVGELDVAAWAAFGELSYRPTPRLELTAGLRYSHERKDHLASVRGVVSPQSTGVKEWHALTPRFVASYDVAPQTLLYVSASRGFKSGGFNSVGNEPAVDPEFLWSYETGLKSRVMDDRLQMELTAFFYDYADLQVRVVTPTIVINDNAAEARIKGVELATKWSPLDPLLLSVSLAYVDSEYVRYDTIDPATGVPADLSGNRLVQSPELKLSGGAQYTWTLAESAELMLRADYSRSGEYFFSQFNTPDVREDGYDLWNASLTLARGHWDFAFWGKNLGNELRYAQVFDTGGLGVRAWLAAPRTYGLRVGYRY
jgi:iron complex outermembrane recepter protein